MLPLSYVEISKGNLAANVRAFRALLAPGKEFACVVKANAYGHGQSEVTGVLEDLVDYFQIDDIEELRLLRKTSQKPAFVFGYVQENDLAEALALGGMLSLYDVERLKLVEALVVQTGVPAKIHVKIDASLGRQGVLLEELPAFIRAVKECPHVAVAGVYSHFANIEDTVDDVHAKRQIGILEEAAKLFREAGFHDFKTHLSATSGVLTHEASLPTGLVRVGVGVYGMWPSEHLEEAWRGKLELKPVMRWVTHVAQVKTVPAGFTIGYGLTFKTERPTVIAVIPQGYSDGYDRKLSNAGEVLIGGVRRRILGRVAMNMFTVDVSAPPVARAGDEVVLLGMQGSECITAEELAEKVGTINYEITTRLSPFLPRQLVD